MAISNESLVFSFEKSYALISFRFSKYQCASVNVKPDDKSNIVFKKGSPHGFKTSIPAGGQTAPIQIEGFRLQWKKAQKKPKKNIISDVINKIIPNFKPLWTSGEWHVFDSTQMS